MRSRVDTRACVRGRAVLAAYAATDPEGNWSEDWAKVWTETGAGQPLPENHSVAADGKNADQLVPGHPLRLNKWRHARGKNGA